MYGYFEEKTGEQALQYYAKEGYICLSFPIEIGDPLENYDREAGHLIMRAIYGDIDMDYNYHSIPKSIPTFHFVVNNHLEILPYRFQRDFSLMQLEVVERCFYGVESGFVVDLGHFDIRIYAISDGNVISRKSLGYGGHDLNLFLHKMLIENNRKLTEKSVYKNYQCINKYIIPLFIENSNANNTLCSRFHKRKRV